MAPNDSKRQLGAEFDHAVVIVGAGPAGLMLAGELALARVDVAIVERRATQEVLGSRALGLHSRTIEVLDQRGIADRFLARGRTAQVAAFCSIPLDISDFPTRHPYGLALPQKYIEQILAGWIGELPVRIYRGREVSGIAQDDAGVDVRTSDGRSLRAEYVVGCDGGRSVIRKSAGIDFAGWDASTSSLIAEVEMDDEPQWGVRHDAIGVHGIGRLEEGGPIRVLVTERRLESSTEPTLRELSEALVTVYGTDFGIHGPTWISRFTDAARQAARYRDGRVLLAGDAAHVHAPVGGQGLNIGVQDAVNLGWKLAQVVKRTSPGQLLDTYHTERYPVAARVLRNTLAQTVLLRHDDRTAALRDVLSDVLSMEEPRKRFAAMMSGLDIRYELGDGHPLIGRAMPDLDLMTVEGPIRMFDRLHEARPVLINFSGTDLDTVPWEGRVRRVDAKPSGGIELPVLGEVAAPDAVVIRPDGYVAWAGHLPDPALWDALTTWFGPPTEAGIR